MLIQQAEAARVNTEIPPELPCPISLDDMPGNITCAAEDLIKHLDRSVMLRVRDIPSYSYVLLYFVHCSNCPSMTAGKAQVAVLFSGGIDSTVIAYLAHRCVSLYAFPILLMYYRHIPL